MAKVLVTGADGFIGSHLVETLVRQGHEVKAFCLYNSFNSWGWLEHASEDVKGKFEVFMGDIRDPFGVEEATKGCEVIYHLAALIAIPYSYHSPQNYVETNVTGTLNILQAARKNNVQKVVHTSTSEVYGTAQYVPINESHPLQGQSPYSATKIGADQIALSFYRSFQTPVCVIRPFNTYGPRQSARAVIPTIITQIANGKKTIELGSLTPTRDFNFVKDTVSGFISCAKNSNSVGEVINIGSNFEISIGDTVKMIAEVLGKTDVKVISKSDRTRPEKSEVERLWACNKKAKEVLNWSPSYGGTEGLRKGLAETADWFLREENLSKYKADIYNI